MIRETQLAPYRTIAIGSLRPDLLIRRDLHLIARSPPGLTLSRNVDSHAERTSSMGATIPGRAAFAMNQNARGEDTGLLSSNFDLVRLVACLAVILLHVSARSVYAYMAGEISHRYWFEAIVANSSTRWAVPVFVMLSGAILLSKGVTWKEVYRRRVPRMLIVLFASLIVYGMWRAFVVGDFDWGQYLLDTANGAPYFHLYFLYVMIGLYAIAPIVSVIARSLDSRTIVHATLAYCVITCIVLTSGTATHSYSRNAVTFAWDYVGYFTLGFLMLRFAKHQLWRLFLLGYLMTVVWVETCALLQGASWNWTLYAWTYFSPMTYVTAVGVFGFLLSVDVPPSAAPHLRKLAPLTLLVYLLHPMVLETVRKAYGVAGTPIANPTVEIALTFILTAGFSFLAALLLRSLPPISRIF